MKIFKLNIDPFDPSEIRSYMGDNQIDRLVLYAPEDTVTSDNLIKYYRLILKLAADWTGFEPEELHRIFRDRYLFHFRESGIVEVLTSTKDAGNQKMLRYIEQIRQEVELFTQGKVSLPRPNQVTEKILYQNKIY